MKIKGILGCLAALLLAGSLSSCDVWGANGGSNAGSQGGNGGEGCEGLPGKEEWTIDDVNEFLNNYETGPFDIAINANTTAIIPFRHINGPRKEWNFFALVNYEFDNAFDWKYQVTFLSCTCRTADVNYWSTMFVKLSSGTGDPDKVKIKQISFDEDDTGHYQAGFWGDSNPIPTASGGTGPDGKVTYDDIKTGFIDHLVGLTYGDIKDWSTEDDIDHTKHPEIGESLDAWSGASVSTNNIIRILQSICEYHIKQERY